MGLIGKGALRQVGVDKTDAATDGYVGVLMLTSVIERNSTINTCFTVWCVDFISASHSQILST